MSDFSPQDGKNYERIAFERHVQSSGDMDSIHGMSNYQILTQESQLFGFYADTGQGKGGQGGPGTGKHVLNTPGMSLEVLGKGLKVREEGDITQLPAKQFDLKRGDFGILCENGDVTIRARNINIIAEGGGNQDGQIIIKANRKMCLRAPDISEECEKFMCRATQEIDIQTTVQKTLTTFNTAIERMDADFGANAKTLIDSVKLNIPKVGEKLDSIKTKGFKALDMLEQGKEALIEAKNKFEEKSEEISESIDTEELDQIGEQLGGVAEDIGAQLEESEAFDELQRRLGGIFGG